MQKIILQPCSDDEAQKNYKKTIQNHVDFTKIKHCLTVDQIELISTNYPDGKLYIWGIEGVEDGKKSNNYKQWLKINIGDVAVFSWDKEFRSRAIVTGTFENIQLSTYLWNDDKYKNIYLLDDIENINISYAKFSKSIDYSENFNYQPFRVLTEEQSSLALLEFNLGQTSYAIDISNDVSKNNYDDLIAKLFLKESLDKNVNGTQRIEQPILRKYLFGKKREAECDICGKTFPVDFLFAAHIKRRADCTLEERKDLKNIIMSACKFGCDDLFEKGYILVDNGVFVSNTKKYISPRIKPYIDNITDRVCKKWNAETEKYFKAHSSRFNRVSP